MEKLIIENSPKLHPEIKELDRSKHPCFNEEVKGKYGRVHLPVAPKCNIQCNYCDRKYDCVNESRPGVSSVVLEPGQTLDYMREISKKGVEISVVGIAGPGDPFANIEETFETIAQVRAEFPEMLFCLSSNGVDVANNIQKIVDAQISHVTITMNAIDPEIAAKIYSWVRFNKKVYRGIEAGKLIIERQIEAIKILKQNNIVVKINSIIIPGINETHIVEVAKFVASLGADIMNCIPLFPNKDTPFKDLKEPSRPMVHIIQNEIKKYIKPMKHCSRCRADAAGLLGHDLDGSISLLQKAAAKPSFVTEKRPYVAVATQEGYLVNQHVGETEIFMIYANTENGYVHIDSREAPKVGQGDLRWIQLSKVLSDCNSLLTSGTGDNPVAILKSLGIKVIQMNGLIEAGLDIIYKGAPMESVKNAKPFKCGSECSGTGGGCG